MSRRYKKTLADYLVIAVSPALIMTLIGSLVFFLLEIFYQGNFTGRLHYILTLFIFAAVLVGRIAIEEGKERAALFAAPLAVAALLTINRFVQFHGAALESLSFVINCGLIALIWWCANKLTWDCTMIDENESSSGEGLLDAAGIGKQAKTVPRRISESFRGLFSNALTTFRRGGKTQERKGRAAGTSSNTAPSPAASTGPDAPETSADPTPPGRWNNWGKPRGKPHTPGVWIVYFSLAALPLFGLGQLAIPAGQAGRRRYVFCLLAVYVASGLGLLLTTSFLGLRRYLRQRRLPMPMLMANTWIMLGCLLIIAVMGLAMFVPRPNAEYAISRISSAMGSPDQKPSKNAAGNDGVKSERAGRPSSAEKTGKTAPGHSDKTDPKGQPSEKRGNGKPEESKKAGVKAPSKAADDAKQPAASDAQKADSQKAGSQKTDSQKSDAQKADVQKSGLQKTDPQKADAQKTDAQKTDAKSEKPREAGSRPPPEEKPKDDSQGSPPDSSQADEKSTDDDTQSSPADPPPPATPDVLSSLAWLLPYLQIAVYVVLGAIAVYWAWRRRAEIWAALADLKSGLQSLWDRLFGRGRAAEQAAAEQDRQRVMHRPFADYADPFATGMSERSSIGQLVKYSFEALEAWGRENGCPRNPDDTPHEFARSAGLHEESLRRPALRLADLYCQLAYAPGQLQNSSRQSLEELWQGMHTQTADPGIA